MTKYLKIPWRSLKMSWTNRFTASSVTMWGSAVWRGSSKTEQLQKTELVLKLNFGNSQQVQREGTQPGTLSGCKNHV